MTDQPTPRRCTCGAPIEWMDVDVGHGSGWIHSPGSDTPCLDVRPLCPLCPMHVDPDGSQPTPADRIPLDELNSDQYDALYDELDQLRAAVHRAEALATSWAVLRAYGSAAYELRSALAGTKEN